jgi:hypothetical protein
MNAGRVAPPPASARPLGPVPGWGVGRGFRLPRAREGFARVVVVPRCPAPRRDGRACGTLAASPTSRFCKRHEALVERWGEERVMAGDFPDSARKRASQVTVETLARRPTKTMFVEPSGSGKTPEPAAIRPAPAQLAAENLDGLQRALLDAALSATTTRWATVACGDCGARSRVELPVPDVRSRLRATCLRRRSDGRDDRSLPTAEWRGAHPAAHLTLSGPGSPSRFGALTIGGPRPCVAWASRTPSCAVQRIGSTVPAVES